MVNVAGGSKGCLTCRRRKLKCDGRRPICERCERNHLTCGPVLQTVKVYTAPNTSRPSSSATRRGALRQDTAEASSATQPEELLAINPRHGISPLKEEIQIGFLAALVQKKVPVNDNINNCQLWVHAAVAHDKTNVVYNAAASIGGLHLASTLSRGTVTKASPRYGEAVRILAQNLKDEERCYDEGNIPAVLLLYIYELALGNTSSRGWFHHNEGLVRLVEFYGPERFQTWLMRKHLMMSRSSIIFFAIGMRQRTFLEHPEWKEIPWARSSLPKLPLQRLLDTVADIPGLRQESDEFLKKANCDQAEDKLLMCDRLQSTLGALFYWRWQWEDENPDEAYLVSVDSATDLAHSDLREGDPANCIWFKEFERAYEIIIYNCALLLLLQLLEVWDGLYRIKNVVSKDLEHRNIQATPLLLPNAAMTAAQVINEIHRCVSYFLNPMHGGSGVFTLYYPLWCCESYERWRNAGLYRSWDPMLWRRIKAVPRPAVTLRCLDSQGR